MFKGCQPEEEQDAVLIPDGQQGSGPAAGFKAALSKQLQWLQSALEDEHDRSIKDLQSRIALLESELTKVSGVDEELVATSVLGDGPEIKTEARSTNGLHVVLSDSTAWTDATGSAQEDYQVRSTFAWPHISVEQDENDILPRQPPRLSVMSVASAPSADSGSGEETTFGAVNGNGKSKQKVLKSGWEHDPASVRGSRGDVPQKHAIEVHQIELLNDDEEENKSVLSRRLIMHPTDTMRLAFDAVAVYLVIFDCIFVPLQLMKIEERGFLSVMTWFTRIFWTLDIPMTFCTGYTTPNGNIELRPRLIAIKYVRNWFLMDFLIVLVDWFDGFDSAGGFDAARVGKTFKGMRLFRLARLFRLIRFSRMPDFLASIAWYFRTDMFSSIAGILKILGLMVLANHLLACAWYGMALEFLESGNETNWLSIYGLVHVEKTNGYAIAFHWAVTQFIGTMEIGPTNYYERIFGILVLLCAYFMSAYVLSSITSSMTKLQLVTAKRDGDFITLKQFLFDNGVSRGLALRIQRNANHALMERDRNIHESSLQLLEIVQTPLRRQMHFEIYSPTLSNHPLMEHMSFSSWCDATMHEICHTAVSRIHVMHGEMIFTAGQVMETPFMFFLATGNACYIAQNGSLTKNLLPGSWASEACLWTEWIVSGTLRSTTDCTMVLLDADKFMQAFQKTASDEGLKLVHEYGQSFVNSLNSACRRGVNHDLMSDEVNPGTILKEECAKMGLAALFKRTGDRRMRTARNFSKDERDNARQSTSSQASQADENTNENGSQAH